MKWSREKTGVGTYDYKGDDKILAYSPVVTTGWSIGMTTFYSEVTNTVTKLGRTIALIGLAYCDYSWFSNLLHSESFH